MELFPYPNYYINTTFNNNFLYTNPNYNSTIIYTDDPFYGNITFARLPV